MHCRKKVTEMQWTITTSLLIVAVVIPFLGCEQSETTQKDKSMTSQVVVLSPATGVRSGSDKVRILLDGQCVFSGVVPVNTSGIDGMPVELIIIPAKPGNHTIEVQHDGARMRMEFTICKGKSRFFFLFGAEDGEPVLLEDCGTDPIFI
jgi:hypothetical protein